MAPAATPVPVVARLNKEFVAVLNDPAVRKQLLDQGIEPVTSTPAEMKSRIDRELKDFGALARRAKLTVE